MGYGIRVSGDKGNRRDTIIQIFYSESVFCLLCLLDSTHARGFICEVKLYFNSFCQSLLFIECLASSRDGFPPITSSLVTSPVECPSFIFILFFV